MLNNLIDLCFDRNDYFYKMTDLINLNLNNKIGEKHHIIPRAYFKAIKSEIIDDNNIVFLNKKDHILIHYYIYKCSKPIIKEQMKIAISFLINRNNIDDLPEENILNEINNINIQAHSKRIICLETKQIFSSIKEASEILNISRGLISNCCNHKSFTTHDLHFEFAYKDFYTDEEINNMMRNYVPIPNTSTAPKQIICIETKQIFNSSRECSKLENIDRRSLMRTLNYGTIHNRHYEIYDPNKDYDLYLQQLNGKRIMCIETGKTYSSIQEANNDLGVSKSHISDVLRKVRNISNSFHWKYIGEEKEIIFRTQKVKCVELNLVFSSKREASEKTHTSRESITKSILLKKKVGKFTWELI